MRYFCVFKGPDFRVTLVIDLYERVIFYTSARHQCLKHRFNWIRYSALEPIVKKEKSDLF